MMYQLRYYAPDYRKGVHENILTFLEEIKTKHNIPYETIQIDQQSEKEIYQKHFMARNRILKQRVGWSIRRMLRSRKGYYNIAGTIAITQSGQVEWYTLFNSEFKEYDETATIGFLKAVLDKGAILLEQLCSTINAVKPELKILDIFIKSGVLDGQFEHEVKVGKQIFKNEFMTFDWRKSIDLICETNTEVWILEGKTKLNYEAVGEVLTYSSLYAQEFPEKKIKMGIICGQTDEDILITCKRYGVTVFCVVGDEIKVHSPIGGA